MWVTVLWELAEDRARSLFTVHSLCKWGKHIWGVLLQENGNIFLYVSEILYVIHNKTHPVSCSEWTHTLNPTSPLSKEKVCRNFPTHIRNFILRLLLFPWLQVNSKSKACRVCLSWVDPFRDCHPKWSQIKPYTDSLQTLYQGENPNKHNQKNPSAMLINNSIDWSLLEKYGIAILLLGLQILTRKRWWSPQSKFP